MSHRTTEIGAFLSARVRRHATRLARGLARGPERPIEIKRARVAARRLREVLALVETGAPGVPVRRLGRGLRDVRRALSEPREAEVNLAEWTLFARRADWPDDRGAVVVRRLERERDRAADHLAAWLRRHDHAAIDRRLARVVEAVSAIERDQEWRAAARKLLLARLGELETVCRSGSTLYAPAQLHDARVAIKKFRYLLEVVGPMLDVPVDPVLDTLRNAQRHCGRLNDREQLRRWASAQAVSARAGSLRLAAEMLADALEVECRALHARALPAVGKLTDVLVSLRRAVALGVITRRTPARLQLPPPAPESRVAAGSQR